MADPGPEPQNVPASHPQCKQDNMPQNNNSSKIILPLQHSASAAQQSGQQVVHLNWSYFKPEFSGKPDEDAEAHLLFTNDWMNAHHFIEGVKVQRFFNTIRGSQIIVSFIRTY